MTGRLTLVESDKNVAIQRVMKVRKWKAEPARLWDPRMMGNVPAADKISDWTPLPDPCPSLAPLNIDSDLPRHRAQKSQPEQSEV